MFNNIWKCHKHTKIQASMQHGLYLLNLRNFFRQQEQVEEQNDLPIFSLPSLDMLVTEVLVPLYTYKKHTSLMTEKPGKAILQTNILADVWTNIVHKYELEAQSQVELSQTICSAAFSNKSQHTSESFSETFSDVQAEKLQKNFENAKVAYIHTYIRTYVRTYIHT